MYSQISESERLRNGIVKWVAENNINLNKRLIPGTIPQLQTILNAEKIPVKRALTQVRNIMDLHVNKPKIVFKTRRAVYSGHQEICINNNLLRASNKETPACDLIIAAIRELLPWYGKALLIGTPTPFCASKSVQNNLFILDNLYVAAALQFTTRQEIEIVIGNSVDPVKAKLKAQDWRSNTITKGADITCMPLDKYSYHKYVNNFAKNNNPAIVVLLTSGAWVNSKATMYRNSKKGIFINQDFKTPSELLVKKYPKNLHILALTNNDGMNFQVRWLRDNKNTLLRWKKKV